MKPSFQIEAKNLTLVLLSSDDVRAFLETMPPEQRKEVSPAWLALVAGSASPDLWTHGFKLVHQTLGVIGHCGFKGPPTADGVVEIAYGVEPEHQGKGYATEAAAAMTRYAFSQKQVRIVCAHTLPEPNASTRVLTKCGFQHIGEVMHPEDGRVWRWEKTS